jgi:hypothetical protein
MLPTLPSLLVKSTMLGGSNERSELREGVDLRINPPVQQFGFFDWDAIYAIVEVGYRHAQACVRAWLDGHAVRRSRDGVTHPVGDTASNV